MLLKLWLVENWVFVSFSYSYSWVLSQSWKIHIFQIRFWLGAGLPLSLQTASHYCWPQICRATLSLREANDSGKLPARGGRPSSWALAGGAVQSWSSSSQNGAEERETGLSVLIMRETLSMYVCIRVFLTIWRCQTMWRKCLNIQLRERPGSIGHFFPQISLFGVRWKCCLTII